MKIKTWDITGFGGGYEATCQQMLWNATRFVINNNKDIKSEQYKNVYGIAINKGEDGKAFDDAMMEGIKDATGAMHHCATNHALYIQKNGYTKWFEELGKDRLLKGDMSYDYEYLPEFELVKENLNAL